MARPGYAGVLMGTSSLDEERDCADAVAVKTGVREIGVHVLVADQLRGEAAVRIELTLEHDHAGLGVAIVEWLHVGDDAGHQGSQRRRARAIERRNLAEIADLPAVGDE